ncbi:MAG: 16S rRNA (cytosine(967)-C(5))-methyltransferase RsmB [Betaproteobacteria bacterium HGW-Betaproteobacteria-11]|nr:MAG: 16S rRNA (cytosine(967)-C(5))-methyltransferase RsmB [Betaproteobacteria bacterium HGW-Betaproteobacteria-11]
MPAAARPTAATASATSAPLAAALLAAADLLVAVRAGRNVEVALSGMPLEGSLRAAAMDLTYTALRAYGRGEFFLSRLISRPLAEPRLHALLLIALARLEAQPVRAHTTVDQAVAAAATLAGGRFKALVNAVLRNFLRRREALLAAAETDEVARHQHPAWWIARLQQDHPEHWQAILAAGNTHPPLTLRINRRRIASAEFLARLDAAGSAAQVLAGGAVRLAHPVAIERIPGFADGLCSVQDAGAQRAAFLLDVQDSQRVLDVCAAPGGKSAHLLELAEIELTALDVDAARAARIGDNLARLGLAATVKVGDGATPDTWWDGRPFDRILADVPCSASGVVRRHPDAKWLRREADIARFAATQRRIIDAIWQTLSLGGKMLYATCSLFAAENEEQVAAFVGRHADAVRLPLAGSASALCLQLFPDAEHDGFYYALLQKT